MSDLETTPAVPAEQEAPADSSTENAETATTEEGTDRPAGGDDKKSEQHDDPKVPFHKHPAWVRREQEWQRKLDDVQNATKAELEKMRQEVKPKGEYPPVAKWFGGDEEQWRQFCDDRKAELEAAVKPFREEREKAETERKAVTEATKFFHSEVESIEADAELNPDGEKIDRNRLLKVVMDNDLIDSKGRWNYRAGFRLMERMKAEKKPDPSARKGLAAPSDRGEGERKKDYMTSQDFTKSSNRPW